VFLRAVLAELALGAFAALPAAVDFPDVSTLAWTARGFAGDFALPAKATVSTVAERMANAKMVANTLHRLITHLLSLGGGCTAPLVKTK
jgi:hypothetical protein